MTDLQNISKAIVKINTAEGSGSGFYLKKTGLVITNHHVIAGNHLVAIELQNKEKISAKVIFVNPIYDLAFLLPAQEFDVPELTVLSSQNIQNGEKVFVLGFPFGMPFTITEGIISSTNQILEGKKYLQTDAAINPGNSGGPLVNANGEILGINTCKFNNADNVGFAIPTDALIAELESIKSQNIQEFSIKCPACNTFLINKSEYCLTCGKEIDPALFAEKELTVVAKFVEEALQKLGVDPIIARGGYDFWEFHQGSAMVRIFVYNNSYIYLSCPLVKLPTTKLNEIYSYILSNPAQPFLLGISEGSIYLSYRIHLSDIASSQRSLFQDNIAKLILKADQLDNYLMTTFNCQQSDDYKS